MMMMTTTAMMMTTTMTTAVVMTTMMTTAATTMMILHATGSEDQHFYKCASFLHAFHFQWGAGIAQWLERRTRDRNVMGSSPGRSGGRIFFSSVNFLC